MNASLIMVSLVSLLDKPAFFFWKSGFKLSMTTSLHDYSCLYSTLETAESLSFRNLFVIFESVILGSWLIGPLLRMKFILWRSCSYWIPLRPCEKYWFLTCTVLHLFSKKQCFKLNCKCSECQSALEKSTQIKKLNL